MRIPPLLLVTFSLGTLLAPSASLAQAPTENRVAESRAEAGAETAESLLTEVQRETAEATKTLQSKIAALDTVLEKAFKEGTLKPSTAAYYRDILERFKTPDGRLPDPERIYYPPRFDTSEEMEPINFAWSDLQRAVTQAQASGQRVALRAFTAVADSLQTAAGSAEKPGDLDNTDKLIAASRALPDPNRPRYAGPSSINDVLARISGAMREVLAAREKGDTDRMFIALQRAAQGGSMSAGFSFGDRSNLPFKAETLWEQFRSRLVAPYYQAPRDAQADVEKKLIERRPLAEIEQAIEDFEKKVAVVERINRETRTNYGGVPDQRLNLARTYRSVLEALRLLESKNEITRSEVGSYLTNIDATTSAEFRVFVSTLRAEIEKKQQERRETLEEEGRRAAEAKEKQRRQQEADRIAREQQEERQALAKAVEQTRQRIASIRTAKGALTAADELQFLLPVSGGPRSNSSNGEVAMAWSQAAQELRQIGAIWTDESIEVSQSPAAQGYDRSSMGSLFVVQLRALRERAARDAFVQRFNAEELQQPPLLEMSTRAAVEKLAGDAAAKGDWQRVLELLGATAPRGDSRIPPAERIQAIRSYLIGLNFEQAEMYQEAIAAYQMVLQQTASGIPIKETAERIKKLRASHPEAFQKPATGAASSVDAANQVRQ